MKSIYQVFLILSSIALLFASCDDEYGPTKESTPFFESATIYPTAFTFGDSITLSATIIDPTTKLESLSYEIVADGKIITTGSLSLLDDTIEVTLPIFVPLLSGQNDNSEVLINLAANNILKSTAYYQITDITGKRPVYDYLYLVTDNGTVTKLESNKSNMFEKLDLTLDNYFSFKIAEKLSQDNTIDYSGAVYGNKNGKVAMIDQDGKSIFAFTPNSDYTKIFTFDNLNFIFSTKGDELGQDDLALSSFGEQDIIGESFRTLTRTLDNNKIYSVFGALADSQNIFNLDFFERISDDKVKFLGETGDYTIFYNPVRKNIFIGTENPSYPDYLLASGWGLGYPTHVTTEEISSVYPGHHRTHSDWGFENVMKYLLLRRIDDNIFQGTFYTPGDHDHYAGFKLFENTAWGNEKGAGQFTFTGEDIIKGDDNWDIPNEEEDPIVESANYRFTVNLNDNTVNIKKITIE